MKNFDRLIIFLLSICVLILSLLIMIFPFNVQGFLSIEAIVKAVRSIDGNYYYVLVGIAFLIVSIRIIYCSLSKNNKEIEDSYLATKSEYGEIIIYSNTIIGLVQNVVDNFSGINNISTSVNLLEGQAKIELRGEVLPETNIPKITKELQASVKAYVENITGAKVKEVKVKINNVSVPSRVVR